MSKLAIIGGTGLNQFPGLNEGSTIEKLKTPFGQPSAAYICGKIDETEIVFLARHGIPHTIPPHKINYRANIWGLKELGVSEIIAVAAVGGITSKMTPSHIVLPDQLIDYSYGREHTFFADKLDQVTHIDFSFPYNQALRNRIIQTANNENLALSPTATYGCTQGPRLETAAEINRMQQDGCDLVGMTGMPEAALAKELDIAYASIAVIVNWAAGKTAGEINFSEIERHLEAGMNKVTRLLSAFFTTSVD